MNLDLIWIQTEKGATSSIHLLNEIYIELPFSERETGPRHIYTLFGKHTITLHRSIHPYSSEVFFSFCTLFCCCRLAGRSGMLPLERRMERSPPPLPSLSLFCIVAQLAQTPNMVDKSMAHNDCGLSFPFEDAEDRSLSTAAEQIPSCQLWPLSFAYSAHRPLYFVVPACSNK
jgi:hypothetical protein